MKDLIKKLIREGLLSEITSKEAWDKYYYNIDKYPALSGNEELYNKLYY